MCLKIVLKCFQVYRIFLWIKFMCTHGNIIIRLLMAERMSETKIYSKNRHKTIFSLDLRNLYLFFHIIVWIKWIYAWFWLGLITLIPWYLHCNSKVLIMNVLQYLPWLISKPIPVYHSLITFYSFSLLYVLRVFKAMQCSFYISLNWYY